METTREKIFNECEGAISGANEIKEWIHKNDWVNELHVTYCICSPKIIRCEEQDKKVLAFNIGSDGWKMDNMNSIKKSVDGIEFSCPYYEKNVSTISI